MSLKKQAVSGVKWTTFAGSITTLLQFIQFAILARLLSPQDFGLMSMVVVVVGFAQAFSDMGVSNATIHRQNITKEELSSLYWLNIAAGVVVFVVVAAASPLISGFYREPRLNHLVVWISLSFLIVPFGQQCQSLLQKELKFNQLAKAETLAAAAGLGTSVITALEGYGVFALIWGQLAAALAKTVVLTVIGWPQWRPMLRFRWMDVAGFMQFGMYQMGERSINYFSSNVDYLVIGRFLGPGALGAYTMAYQLVVTPMLKFNPIITRVAFPVFAKRQSDNAALRRGYLETSKLLALVILPALISLGVLADLVVPVVFGKQWVKAVPLVQILAALGVLRGLGNPSGSIYLAKGRADIGFKWNLVVTIINTAAFWFVVRYGIYVMSWTNLALSALYFIAGLIIMKALISLGYLKYLRNLSGPLVLSLTLGLILFMCHRFTASFTTHSLPLLIGLTVFGIFVYGVLLLLFERDLLSEMRALLSKQKEVSKCPES